MPENSDSHADQSSQPWRRPGLNVVGKVAPRDLAVFSAAVPSPAATRFDASEVGGTVGAAVPSSDADHYGPASGDLLSAGPLGVAPHSEAGVPPGLRASLIAELRDISGQVNRMMTQVDHAIRRLGEHAGEPLRR